VWIADHLRRGGHARPYFIKTGTLDDTSWLAPKMHIYCDSAQRWVPIPEGSQKFAKMPA
jgi:hypothetical protein